MRSFTGLARGVWFSSRNAEVAPVLGASRRVGGRGVLGVVPPVEVPGLSEGVPVPSPGSVGGVVTVCGVQTERSCTRTCALRASQTEDSRQLEVPVVALRRDFRGGWARRPCWVRRASEEACDQSEWYDGAPVSACYSLVGWLSHVVYLGFVFLIFEMSGEDGWYPGSFVR